jgi:ferredoxin-NADP reductase
VTDDAPRDAWLTATVRSVREETARVKTIAFAVSHWPGHLAGQHADVRLTAADGYRAERSYSIASPPESSSLELTVERLEEGEVSPFLTDVLRQGDTIQLRGPIGRYFVWTASEAQRPLLLVGGGTGIVPLMCILRHRRLAGSTTPASLLYSARHHADVIFHDEILALAKADSRFTPRITLSRESPAKWPGVTGRITSEVVRNALGPSSDPDAFVCGSAAFVETASELLLQAGLRRELIRTERFGPSGV